MQQPGGEAVLDAIVEALSQLDVRAVVTTGVDPDGLDLPELPAHVEVRRFADQFLNAEQVARTGAGTALIGEDQTSDRIAVTIEDVLTGAYDAAVQRIATDALDMPSLADGVWQLEALATSH